jgi:hypothetical protein
VLESKRRAIKATKFLFRLLEHPEIQITLSGLKMPNCLHVLGTNGFDNDPAHKTLISFDEIGERLFNANREVEWRGAGRDFAKLWPIQPSPKKENAVPRLQDGI